MATTTALARPLSGVSVQGRWLHPGAWWLWAIGLATAASRTTNPVLLGLILAVAGTVVAARRPEAPWSRSFSVFLRIGLIVIAVRVVFQVLLGLPQGNSVLFTLPSVALPEWLAGVRIGGVVTWESIVYSIYDGLRLATVLACLGAASSLASPYRLLKAMPAALYEVGVSLVVALSFAPALVGDIQRVRAARRLRGRPTSGLRGITGSAMPVFSGALDRSIALAAAMDSRGYGRSVDLSPRERRTTGALVLGGLVGVGLGLYALLDGSAVSYAGLPLLMLGTVAAVIGLVRGGRRNGRTRYRPDPWRWPETLTAGTGLVTAVAVVVQGIVDPGALTPSISPLQWPEVPWIAAAGVLTALLPAWLTPTPPSITGRSAATREAP
ncbi:MAG: energy-coupling factor transporter transmembrane component T [Candidatus Nanopelagicales bacterium]